MAADKGRRIGLGVEGRGRKVYRRGNERKRGRAESDDEIMHVLGDSG